MKVSYFQASRMKNDTSAILVGIEKLETSLENAVSSASGSSINSESLISAIQIHLKPTLDAVHSLVNETHRSQIKLDDSFREGWESLSRGIDKSVVNVTDVFETRLATFENKMSESQKLIQDQVPYLLNYVEITFKIRTVNFVSFRWKNQEIWLKHWLIEWTRVTLALLKRSMAYRKWNKFF